MFSYSGKILLVFLSMFLENEVFFHNCNFTMISVFSSS